MNPSPRPKALPPIIALLFGILIITGCTSHRFSVMFQDIDGLKTEDPVLFKSSPVGKVDRILYTQEGVFQVFIDLHKDFKNAATDRSRFTIQARPGQPGKALVIRQDRPGGTPIPDGGIVMGTEMTPKTMFNHLIHQWKAKALELLSDLEGIPETEQYRILKEKMADLEKQMATSGKAMGDFIRNQIIPLLEQQIQDLTEKLRQMGETDKAQSLERELDRLQTL